MMVPQARLLKKRIWRCSTLVEFQRLEFQCPCSSEFAFICFKYAPIENLETSKSECSQDVSKQWLGQATQLLSVNGMPWVWGAWNPQAHSMRIASPQHRHTISARRLAIPTSSPQHPHRTPRLPGLPRLPRLHKTSMCSVYAGGLYVPVVCMC